VKVSWQITSVRRDPYAARRRLVVEEAMTGDDRGRYTCPEDLGRPASMAIPQRRSDGTALAPSDQHR
jgi:hypothetical protein